ncbi:MAG: DUF433 domain-containing protein [Gemmatimonadaceae bacterium]
MRGSKFTKRSAVDPREVPAYPIAEAARYLRLPPATLRAWVLGRTYAKRSGSAHSPPLIIIPDRKRTDLSFSNLVEAHVLRALRTVHEVEIKDVRTAIAFAEREYSIKRFLLSPELLAAAGELFLDKYGELVSLSQSGQLAMRKVLERYLKRVERDEHELPIRLYPTTRDDTADGERVIAIDARIAFGRPVVLRQGIETASIAQRIDARESVAEVAEDYGLTIAEVEEAVIYEHAA